MSTLPDYEPVCEGHGGPVDLTIEPRTRDLGGFSVRRVLPSASRRMVGPFIFFDEMGPAVLAPGQGLDVRPHPHIGLATITYLFEGELMHRDSLGFVQPIRPGAVNLMTAGRGIVHSERSGDDRAVEAPLHGLQLWIALPEASEEIEPGFVHYPAGGLPELELGGTRIRLVMGEAFGHASPVRSYSPLVYLEARLPAGASFTLPTEQPERGVYVVSGSVDVTGDPREEHHAAGVMLIARPGADVELTAREASRVVVIGGEPVGPRHIWWNFVSSSKSRIEQAKDDWRAMRFGTVPGDDEFIPLPEA
jgi:redox-sensitive bicupin YhaK (pirin superfamily)